jgi:hypothetical protein
VGSEPLRVVVEVDEHLVDLAALRPGPTPIGPPAEGGVVVPAHVELGVAVPPHEDLLGGVGQLALLRQPGR